MRYIIIVTISCAISLILEKMYLSLHKRRTIGNRTYYPSIWIVAIIVFVCISILGLKIFCENDCKYFQEAIIYNMFSVICVLVSSGMHLIILMLLSNFIIRKLVEVQYEGNENEIDDMKDGITVLYTLAIIITAIYSLLYLKAIEVFLTYIAVLLGKFIWFDMNKSIDTMLSMMKLLKKGYMDLWNKHRIMLMFEGALFGLFGMGLIYMKNSGSNNPLYDLNSVCFGVGLSGAILIYWALLEDKRVRQDKKEYEE